MAADVADTALRVCARGGTGCKVSTVNRAGAAASPHSLHTVTSTVGPLAPPESLNRELRADDGEWCCGVENAAASATSNDRPILSTGRNNTRRK